jgi:hypothetical protein
MTSTTPWRIEWYLDGKLVDKVAGIWSTNLTDGIAWTRNWNPKGIQAGDWELRILVGEKISTKGFFTVVSRPAGAPTFGAISFAEGVKDDQAVNIHQPNQIFKTGSITIAAFFTSIKVTQGTAWESRWSRNGDLIANSGVKGTWKLAPDGLAYLQLNDKNGLANGTYALKLLIDGEIVQLATFVIGE